MGTFAINNKKKQIIKHLFFGILSLIMCALFGSSSSYAQNLIFDHYGLNEGLPQETIHCITKDKDGFLWLGTSDGVVRFDGHDFVVPLADDINGYRIGAILANNSNLYIGTGQKGLLSLNLQTEVIKQLHISDSNCTRITTHDSLVIATYYNQGVVIITNDHVIPLTFNSENPKEILGLAVIDDMVYLASKNGSLYNFHLDTQKLNQTITLNKICQTSFQINNIVALNNSLFICSNDGIFKLSDTLTPEKVNISTTNSSENFKINDIIKTDKHYYIATNSGLLKCTYSDSIFTIVKHFKSDKKYDAYTINSDDIYTLFYDNELLYIGNINLDIAAIKSNPVFEQPTDKFKLKNPSVFAVIETENFLFIGTSSGLIISDNKNLDHYIILPQYDRIRSFTQDNENYIWFVGNKGANVIALNDLNLNDPKIIGLPVSENNPLSIPNENLRSVYTDNENTTWIVTYNSGFSKFTGSIKNNDLKFKNYSAKSFPSLFTLSMLQDQNGSYWMCTQNGLSKFTIENEVFKLIKNYDETNGLATKGVLSAFIDSNETLWVASRKGLNKYNAQTDHFTAFGKRDGLTNTFVYNITEDDNKNLWLSTNDGLFSFNVSEETFANYNPKDGVQSTEFNLGAVFKNINNGNLYFGGINGLNIFNPKRIGELDKEGELKFTNLKIKDAYVSPIASSNVIPTSIINTKSIHLNYDDFPVNLSFSALDFRPNSNTNYVYKLLPDDADWNTLNTKNNLQLLNLSSKSYTLQIQGTSRNNLWQKPPLELKISVTPPWFKSNLAYLTYLLLFLGIVYAFYKISLQRQIAGQESKRLQDLDDLKSRFITNITHEFRTPLTVILGYLSNLKERYSEKEEINVAINTIEQNSNNLLHLVNQMLDLAKLEQGKLTLNTTQSDVASYIQYLTHSFSSIAEEKSIILKFESEFNELKMDFDAEKMRQILTNLISNALKFSSEDTHVTVALKKINNQLEIKVIDQGLGIPEDELPHIFDRFFQVDNQDYKVSQGTGIGLSLTKELVQLMEGDIEVHSAVNQGTTFTVRFPIKNSAQLSSPELKALKSTIGETYVPQLDDIITPEDTNSVLIVEDNTDMARYIASCLQEQYKVTFAKNGLDGFEKAKETIPDIIITDVMMPVMDGFELTQKLQAQIATNHIPIVMLTSKAMQDDKLEGISSGADAYLTKPFQKEELLLRMQMLIAKRKKLQENYLIDTVAEKTELKKQTTDKNLIFLNTIIEGIHNHLDDSNFGATELAQFMTMSDSQLYRKLKAISNTSTSIFIRKIRLEKSKELLKNSNLSISEIAYSTGFNDPNWFSKAFKEEFGESPSYFRN
ncbi:hybrid sensor histidine kinase/response regulator transcription factor [Psychroserpens ponticola]|uniref:histidine kinase n=1 Tax=Psychroserpens ponticola TaxID=2932268 RepID=A0ABY7RXY6_9FLAO|nr:hybrid sensor histidine kinase/response regulator transcription factor [Psychroserpens ponticola]WCO02006.1 ATP-binding protein [Psychroserpens ponticola]